MPSARTTAAVLLLAGILAPAAAAAADGAPATDTEQVVVEFADDASGAQRTAALRAAGATVLERVDGTDFALVEVPAGTDLDAAAIVDVDEPVALSATVAPNDPSYGSQWNFTAVQAEAAWDVANGAGAIVAVIDTGVARGISDFTPGTFVAGYDFVDRDTDPNDANGHGTHVAGTIAQATNNGVGVAGLAHGARIMPLRVLDARGQGTDVAVADAIGFAVRNGADVINLSLGGPTPSSVLQAAVRDAAANGVVIVAAAGNEGGAVNYPAAYEEVVAVGAVDRTLARATFSAYGAALDLVAPGVGIVQMGSTGTLQSKQGTSMASPHVAAAAAMLAGVGASASEIRGHLLASAADLGPAGRDDQFGAGLLQVASALARAAQPAAAPTSGGGSAGSGGTAPSTGSGGGGTTTPPPPPVHDVDDACPEGDVPRGSFDDVDPSSTHARTIDCVSWLGIANGVTYRSYQPSMSVTRGQMATFLAKVLERSGVTLPSDAPNAFGDDDGTAHETATNQLAALGVLRGTGPGTYAPTAPVSRAAMATFLVAVHDLAADEDLPSGGDAFRDDDGNVHESAIGSLAGVGIATGTGAATYGPAGLVTRAQLATFVARTVDALVDAGALSAP